MWNAQLCLGTSGQFGASVEEQIRLFKKTGFDGFFTGWSKNADIEKCKKLADELGMVYQSIHAPFTNAAKMWEADAKDAVDELLACLNDCAANSVPIMIVHPFIGFESHTPTKEGIVNFGKIVKAAAEKNVKIAFENVEGEEYLAALMNAFGSYDCVGFCWDTGHEMCYNHSADLLSLYGDKLLCTHLNDNLGIRDFSGNITWLDDLHLLPFDGIADWNAIARRLNDHHYAGILTFELNKKSKPDRIENDVYDKMPLEEYLTEVYKRACRVAALKLRKRLD
jgi:sugar phosphate isomerase/epimerase